MKLKFKTYKLNENSRTWEALTKSYEKSNKPVPENRFVVVGEDKKAGYLLVHQDDMLVIADLKITKTAYGVKKEDLMRIPNEYAEYDIPIRNLTMKIIEEIQSLNSEEEN